LIRGLHEGGVLACGKHFPGHGDTPEDSHKSLPVLPHTWDRLRWMELVPFQAAIAAGVPLLMTAHILYGVIDAALPATLSKRAITGLLREELGFNGVIVTDDLEMGAIARYFTPEEAAVRALGAGCDLALICANVAATQRAMAAVTTALHTGVLSETLFAQSVMRIKRLLQKIPTTPASPDCIGCRAHQTLIDGLASA
jgi:beta-N-acetylhexosaminidase